MHNHGYEEEVEEAEDCEEVIRTLFITCENPMWCFAKAAKRKFGRFAFGLLAVALGSLPKSQLFSIFVSAEWVNAVISGL
jgi:hypothetical protein